MCKQCEKKPVYEFTNKRKICKDCFINYFQKKVFYTIRKFKMINKNETIGYENKGDFRDVALEDILKIFVERAIVDLIKIPTTKKFDKLAISSTTNLEADKIIHILIKNSAKDLVKLGPIEKLRNKIIIKPFYLFLDEEVLLYVKLKKLKFKKTKIKNDKISDFVNNLENKHPEIKRAVISSFLELYC